MTNIENWKIQKTVQTLTNFTFFPNTHSASFSWFPPSSIFARSHSHPWETHPRTTTPPRPPTLPPATFRPPIPASTPRARKSSPTTALASTKQRHLSLLSPSVLFQFSLSTSFFPLDLPVPLVLFVWNFIATVNEIFTVANCSVTVPHSFLC